MVHLKRASKEIDINRRHSGAFTGNDRHTRRILWLVLERLRDEHEAALGNPGAARRIWRMVKSCVRKLVSIMTIPEYIKVRYHGERLRIDSESIQEAMIGVTYRFKSRQQLRELYTCLEIPEWFRLPDGGHKIHGEELLLMALERCVHGTRLIDLQQKYHIFHSVIGKSLNVFARWMQDNWGYLIHDNTEFWVPYLEDSRNAIVRKMREHYDVEVEDIDDQGRGFKIALFIDCMIIASSRTGGGPMTPGKFAERFPLLVQESFYSGWARVHGVKKQGMGMANGMAFNISKGYSCRRHDMHLLGDRKSVV